MGACGFGFAVSVFGLWFLRVLGLGRGCFVISGLAVTFVLLWGWYNMVSCWGWFSFGFLVVFSGCDAFVFWVGFDVGGYAFCLWSGVVFGFRMVFELWLVCDIWWMWFAVGLGFNCVSRYSGLHIIALFTLWFRCLVCGLDLGLVLDLLG